MGGVTGFVVAGGRSRRMGRDKALLPWGDATLLDHALARLRDVTDDVRILCGSEERYADRGVQVVTDLVSDASPLGGLLAGLTATDKPLTLLLGVDLPLVPSTLLRFLVEIAPGADAVVPFSHRDREPLCAAYGRSCLDPIRASVARGDLRMDAFWPEVRVRRVTPSELSAFGDPVVLFSNVNSPEDHEAISELGRALRHRGLE